jgi:hypothetical protein
MKRRFVAVLAALTLSAALPAAQAPRLLDKDTFFDMEGVSNPAISPDGKHIVFGREWVDTVKDQSRSNLWTSLEQPREPMSAR